MQVLGTKRTSLLPFMAALALVGCGYWPPVAESGADLARIAGDTRAIRPRGISDDDVSLLGRFKEVEWISFFSGWGVVENRLTDDGVKNLASLDLPKLNSLFLGPSKKITDDALQHLLHMKQLKVLGLPECTSITDKGMELLARMEWLTYLDLRGNPGITDAGIAKLESLKGLRHLVLDGMPNVTPDALDRLKKALPECRVEKDDANWRLQMGG